MLPLEAIEVGVCFVRFDSVSGARTSMCDRRACHEGREPCWRRSWWTQNLECVDCIFRLGFAERIEVCTHCHCYVCDMLEDCVCAQILEIVEAISNRKNYDVD